MNTCDLCKGVSPQKVRYPKDRGSVLGFVTLMILNPDVDPLRPTSLLPSFEWTRTVNETQNTESQTTYPTNPQLDPDVTRSF